MAKIKSTKLFEYSFKLWVDYAMPKMHEHYKYHFAQPKQKIYISIPNKGDK